MGLNRHEEGIITRLRLGHTGLNSILSLIGKSNGICSECKVLEDVTHVLFRCKKFDQLRQKWKDSDAENDIPNILHDQGMQGQRSKYFITYLNDTGLSRII